MLKKQNAWMRMFALFFLVVSCALAYPQRGPRSVFLGRASVDGRLDHDTIPVGKGAGPLRAIQLRVVGGTVEFHRVVVRYGNGTAEVLRVNSVIPSGGQTRPIGLAGNRRAIRSVDLWYGKAHWRTRPIVSLFGIR